jgi:hypothetical protein
MGEQEGGYEERGIGYESVVGGLCLCVRLGSWEKGLYVSIHTTCSVSR